MPMGASQLSRTRARRSGVIRHTKAHVCLWRQSRRQKACIPDRCTARSPGQVRLSFVSKTSAARPFVRRRVRDGNASAIRARQDSYRRPGEVRECAYLYAKRAPLGACPRARVATSQVFLPKASVRAFPPFEGPIAYAAPTALRSGPPYSNRVRCFFPSSECCGVRHSAQASRMYAPRVRSLSRNSHMLTITASATYLATHAAAYLTRIATIARFEWVQFGGFARLGTRSVSVISRPTSGQVRLLQIVSCVLGL
ncbi:hypothetical protein C8Q73DRAFT_87848 [Cubamyces lactineus]|nr:hypothetical protein C8Q73DRAFT_87848 [Cubamyces lactineus]